ncbi:MAG: AI-2E family transporter [Vicinamibacterales bacterium]
MAEHDDATESEHEISLRIPWSTLVKVLAAIALLYIWREIVWLLVIGLIASLIAVGLAPIVQYLERRNWPRTLAALVVVTIVVSLSIAFFVVTWSSVWYQSDALMRQVSHLQDELRVKAPKPVVNAIDNLDATQPLITEYAAGMARSLMTFLAAFVFAWVLVFYLLVEGQLTYLWVRGFVPARLRKRLDRTAVQARDAAYGYVVGNVVTSICAAVYVFVTLSFLHVPATLLMALLAFVFDFVPVLGVFFSGGAAMVMASTVSPLLGLAMIPLYLAYHAIENYVIGPYVYGPRLRLSNVAILIALALGTELGGVAGALLALPIAAVYPSVERFWLREPFGEEVVAEHDRLRTEQA